MTKEENNVIIFLYRLQKKKVEIRKMRKQFNKEQQKEILEGIKQDLDISIYAKKEFDSFQMAQIREGLEGNLDVSLYAKPEYNADQMWQIFAGLDENVEVSWITNSDLD